MIACLIIDWPRRFYSPWKEIPAQTELRFAGEIASTRVRWAPTHLHCAQTTMEM